MKSDQIEKARQVKALGSPDPKNPRYLWLERNGKRGYFIPNKEEYDLEKAESILLGIDPEEEIVKAQFSELELAEDLLLK